MSSSEAASSVKRTAVLKQAGKNYTLVLLENDRPVENFKPLTIKDMNEQIHKSLKWVDDGIPFDDAIYSSVTKGSSFLFEGNRYPVEDPTPFEQKYPANEQRQRQKSLADLIINHKEHALLELQDMASYHKGVDSPDPAQYCEPKKMCTWNDAELQEQVKKKSDELSEQLKLYTPQNRRRVCLGIRLGSGCGKTHVLSEAGRWLGAPLIYVTYNQYQLLNQDRLFPRNALLIRLILAVMGIASPDAGGLFQAQWQTLFDKRITTDLLRDLFLFCAKKAYKGQAIVIGVDETKCLEDKEAAQAVISELGDSCNVLEAPASPHPEHAAALLAAVAGGHIRSLVVARNIMKANKVSVTVPGLLKKMKSRLGLSLQGYELAAIKSYVLRCIEESPSQTDTAIQPYTDEKGAVAPTLILMAFSLDGKTQEEKEDFLKDSQDALLAGADKESQDAQLVVPPAPEDPVTSALLDVFNSATLFVDAPKQLEEMSKAYDKFRQCMGLPVVPRKARIRFPNEGKFQEEKWYRELVFPSEMEEDKQSLLKQEREIIRPSAGKKKETVKVNIVPTGVKIRFGDYFHPGHTSHPWVDRAFAAKHAGTDELCLVLAQDKINAQDFPTAVRNLNKAAHVLSLGFRSVLCIANIIGASSETKAQSEFEFPYILIRDEPEVRAFFSVNFSVPVIFSRKRHLLQLQHGVVDATKKAGAA
ncbi:expressed unknown protein [Seminavis robusta]|uniref:Uncharacterized protein n=1 Tax=Seminavis robusta TaxID=568900 RepID=A0A9N8F2K0_9STRA|nr:expressed unknown protein [Seminavis robusta]|eukprot:Sro3053_g342860.1 n/a (701) ;mRNA; f:4573-6962